jgi:hypothetical protein
MWLKAYFDEAMARVEGSLKFDPDDNDDNDDNDDSEVDDGDI